MTKVTEVVAALKNRTLQRTTILGAAVLALLWGVDAVQITTFLDGLTKIVMSALALEAILYDERGEG